MVVNAHYTRVGAYRLRNWLSNEHYEAPITVYRYDYGASQDGPNAPMRAHKMSHQCVSLRYRVPGQNKQHARRLPHPSALVVGWCGGRAAARRKESKRDASSKWKCRDVGRTASNIIARLNAYCIKESVLEPGLGHSQLGRHIVGDELTSLPAFGSENPAVWDLPEANVGRNRRLKRNVQGLAGMHELELCS